MNPQFSLISNNLKKALKLKKVKYAELAKALGMSESGIKKMLSNDDISLNKLSSVCDTIEVSLEELVKSTNSPSIKKVKLSSKQESFLRKNKDHFYFFWALTVNSFSVEKVKKKYNLTVKTIEKYLLDLDREKILNVGKDYKISGKINSKVSFGGLSPFEREVIEKFHSSFFSVISKKIWRKSKEGEKDILFRFGTCGGMREKTYKEFKNEIAKILEKYINRATVEKPFYPEEELIPVGSMLIVSPFDFSEVIKIQNI